MNWLAIIIPVLCAIVALVFFRNKVAIWEPFIPILLTAFIIVFFKFIGIQSLTKDTEYWGNYVTKISWYQEWDEWIEQTCTRTYPCGSDSKGNTKYCTEPYDCSYCANHSQYWTLTLNDNKEIKISNAYFNYLKTKFKTVPIFVDMHRDFYRIDGDKYVIKYPNTYDAFEFYATEHKYENKIQASTSIFNYPKIQASDTVEYKLYNYPTIVNNELPAILTPATIPVKIDEQRRFSYINGMLGMSKQVRVWVCLFDSKNSRAGYMQEAYWKRGNKNEFVICIGTNKNRDIHWVHIFGWSAKKILDIETRNFIKGKKKLNLSELGIWLYPEIEQKWEMSTFEEFNNLVVEQPTWSIIITWIITICSCLLLYLWIIKNRFVSNDINGDGYEEYNESDKYDLSKIKYISIKIKIIISKIKKFFINIIKHK